MRTLALFALTSLIFGCQDPQPKTPEKPTQTAPARSPAGLELAAVEIDAPSGTHRFKVELAKTNPQRQRGLMHREQMNDDAGMLFLFPRQRVQSFWMKNTLLPLDMLFIDDKGRIVGIVENAEPMTTTSRTVGIPSMYVLELNAGMSRRLGLKAGQVARFIDVPGHPIGLQK